MIPLAIKILPIFVRVIPAAFVKLNCCVFSGKSFSKNVVWRSAAMLSAGICLFNVSFSLAVFCANSSFAFSDSAWISVISLLLLIILFLCFSTSSLVSSSAGLSFPVNSESFVLPLISLSISSDDLPVNLSNSFLDSLLLSSSCLTSFLRFSSSFWYFFKINATFFSAIIANFLSFFETLIDFKASLISASNSPLISAAWPVNSKTFSLFTTNFSSSLSLPLAPLLSVCVWESVVSLVSTVLLTSAALSSALASTALAGASALSEASVVSAVVLVTSSVISVSTACSFVFSAAFSCSAPATCCASSSVESIFSLLLLLGSIILSSISRIDAISFAESIESVENSFVSSPTSVAKVANFLPLTIAMKVAKKPNVCLTSLRVVLKLFLEV